MFKDDDEEEENTFGVTRYPCMPSLVALQQMRNRLHLALLGRKLMKWTALATGRELRRLAQELYVVYDGFDEDLRNAFILLARSRYFLPNLNTVVSEDIGKKAGVLVQQCGRTVSGVKIVQFEIFETEYPPYPHLGIEKGGQTIMETKEAWFLLLKRLIMMMQLRAGFLMVELANKNANKKMNVLAKIVIPRTNVTMEYINNELEELAREEFFRLKKVLEIKRRMYGDKSGNKKIRKESEDDHLTCPECIEEAKQLKEKAKALRQVMSIEQGFIAEKDVIQDKHLIELIKQLCEIVDVTKDMDRKGLVTASVDDFIKSAEELKSKLLFSPEPEKKIEKVTQEIDELKCVHTNSEDDIDMNQLCEACREKYTTKKKEPVVFEDVEDEELEDHPKSMESIKTVKLEDPPKSMESIKTVKLEDHPKSMESIKTVKLEDPPKSMESIKTVKLEDHPKSMESIETVKLEDHPKSMESIETVKSKQSSTQDPQTRVEESDAELGTFETEFKEITKIIKTKNEDGSISIQRKVIKIQREVKTSMRHRSSQDPSQNNSNNPSGNVSYQPSNTSSGKSNPYSKSRTIGVVTVSSSEFKDNLTVPNIIMKKAKSAILSPFSPMSDPVERFCMSSVTLLSTDLDFDSVTYTDTNNETTPNWICLKASNPVIEDIFSNYEPGFFNTSTIPCIDNCASKNSIDINLDNTNQPLSECKSQKEIGISISDSTCTKKCSKKLGLSVSFNIKTPSSSATLNKSNNDDKNK